MKRSSFGNEHRRYTLTRRWSDNDELGWMQIIMLNPSVGDDQIDDPTIRRCIAFAQRDGYGGISLRNLFSFRSPSPAALRQRLVEGWPHLASDLAFVSMALAWAATKNDPIKNDPIIVAWGAWPTVWAKQGVPGVRERIDYVTSEAAEQGVPLLCWGTTKDGSPRHPLYLKSDTPLVPWEPNL